MLYEGTEGRHWQTIANMEKQIAFTEWSGEKELEHSSGHKNKPWGRSE